MKTWMLLLIAILIVALVGGAGYLGSRSARVEATPEAPTTAAVTRGDVQQTVTAPGQVIGTREVVLGMDVGGQLAEIDVRPGDVVRFGTVLARLDTRFLEEALEAAQLKLAQAQADHTHQLAEAQLNLQIAQARLAKAKISVSDLGAAEADLVAARSELQEKLSGLGEDELAVAAAELRRAQIALQEAQWDYDQVAYRGDVGAMPEARQLEEATLDYQAKLASYRLATQGASESDIARARAQVQQAQAEYERALNQQRIGQQEIAVLEAEVEKENLALERLRSGVDPWLKRDVAAAQQNLAAATLTAPFDGVVLEVMVRRSEMVPAGASVILLADPAAVEVRTTVIEEDLPLVRVGQPVELFFDAQPDAAVSGQVARIVPQRVSGEDRSLYHVYVGLAELPEGIVSGMTADASIIIARQSDVLRLPRAVVQARADGTATVKVWHTDGIENRTIQVGLRGDVYVEIREGLNAGEQVIAE